ncbi:MAG: hypothetical protein JXR34_00025 [Bacteroidales bacterium]|nr:hypothetical protein [Bacteroidales bacterium]
MKKINRIFLLFVGLMMVFLPQQSKAQYDMTLYHMTPVIQSNLSNPAFIPEYSYHFGVPGLSSVYAQMGTSGVRFNQMFTRRSDDSLVIDFDNISKNIKDKNNITLRSSIQWLNGGMKWKDYYFTFSVSEHIDANMFYSDDLINLGINGNAPYVGQTISVDPTFLKATHYREYAFGAAWDFDQQWNFGARAKMLFGKSNIYTKTLDANLTTAENTYYLTTETNMLINTSAPKSWFDGSGFSLGSDYLFYGGSFGLGFDLGATYKLDETFSFSASVLDLGYMKFDRNFVNYSNSNNIWTFEGIDPRQFEELTDDQITDRIEEIRDSLINRFDIAESWTSYTIPMTAKIYLSASYKLSDIETVSAALRSEIVNKTWRPTFTASYYRQLLPELGVIGAYTVTNRSFANFGLGAYYNIKPVQIYIVTDNIIGVFVPDAVRYANIHFGINIFLPEAKTGRTLINLD